MSRSTARPAWWLWLLWAAILALVTLALLGFRPQLDKAHVALLYLLVVLGSSASGGRAVGLTLAAVAFLLFDILFLPPYYTFTVGNPLDWLVLVAFLIVSVVVAEMLHRLQAEAASARERTAEVDRLAQVGAESLKAGRADEALATVTEAIRSTVGVSECRIHTLAMTAAEMTTPPDPLVTWVGEHDLVAIRQTDGTTRLTDSADVRVERLDSAQALFLPLQVRGRTVGVLELGSGQPIHLLPTQQRYLAALAYYAALAVERARLEAASRHLEALREADQLKDALIASVSHDLRTPLTTIKALAHDIAGSDDRAFVIEEEADRLNRLVADLLDLSRIQGGSFPVRLELNAVDDLIGTLLQRVAGVVGNREIAVDLTDGTMLVGRFDLVQSLRILVNLLENAHKYAPASTPIELSARRVGDLIEVAIRDHGPGVPPSEVERIFQPFYRAPGHPPDVGGAGLGLAIARELARAQGGELVYSLHREGGAVFTLSLPAADLPPAGPAF